MGIGQLIAKREKPFFSVEFYPPAAPDQLPAFYQAADELLELGPLFASVTYGAGGRKQNNSLEVTGELSRRGYATLAHLTCVGAEPEALDAYLSALEEKGVGDILAMRGDPPSGDWNWEDGHFRHAEDLIKFIRKTHPGLGIGAAVYPYPHPESPTFESDRKFTARKLASGADFAITQLFFDVREYLDLTARLRGEGITAPVVPGIFTIQSLDSLRRVLSLCGATIPAKFYLALEQANARGGAERVREVGLEHTLGQIRQLLDAGAPGVHLYTLNKSGLCSRIARESGLA